MTTFLEQVDAALDLSHTQNIGRMIKTHFPHSQVCTHSVVDLSGMNALSIQFEINLEIFCLQFIVVSLKEGMFNNANVLFRTKFVDGVSTVQRTVATKK